MAIFPDGPVRIPSQDWLRDQSIGFLNATKGFELTSYGATEREGIATLYAKSIYRQAFNVPNRAWLYNQTAAFIEVLPFYGYKPPVCDPSVLTDLWASEIYNAASTLEVCEGFQKLKEALQ